MVAVAAGKEGADATCPKTGKAYAAGDALACGDPERHLDSGPRYVKRDGAWVFEQALPAPPPELDVAQSATWMRFRAEPGRLVLEERPRVWWRWIVGPALVLLAAFLGQLAIRSAVRNLRECFGKREGRGSAVVLVALSLLPALVAFWIAHSVLVERRYEIENGSRTIVVRKVLFGREWEAPGTAAANCNGVASVGHKGTRWVVVAHEGASTVLLQAQAEQAGPAAAMVQRALMGR
jgi:hypothetical protein